MLPPHFCVPVAVVKKQQVEGEERRGEGGVSERHSGNTGGGGGEG